MGSRLATALVGLALTATPAFAQDAPPDAPPEPSQDVPKETHKEGEYGGVKPGDGQAAKARRARAGTLMWVGFSAEGGTGHVFLQSSSELGYEQTVEGKVLVVRLTGVQRFGRQVRRPLDTRFFESPVVRVTVKKVRAQRKTRKHAARKAGVEVRIQMKGDAHEAAIRSAVEADGNHYLYVDVSP